MTPVFDVDLRSLAIYRFALGALVAVDTAHRATDLLAHYGDYGVLPRYALLEKFINVHYVSVYLANGTEFFNALMFLATIFCALAMAIGWRTRMMTVLSWLLMIALHARNPMVLQAGDVLFRLLLFWAMFLPLGARWSVDSGIAREAAVPKDNRHRSIAGAGLLIQVASVYWFTVLQKTGKEWWPDGTAVYYALHIDIFATRAGVWIRQFPELLKFATLGSIVGEAVIPFLLLAPVWTTALRCVGILAVLGMHASFGFFMELGNFPWVDWVSVLPFIPGPVWNWLGGKLRTPERTGLRVLFDPARDGARKLGLVARSLLLYPDVKVEPFDAQATQVASGSAWVVRDHAGKDHVGRDGCVTMLHASLFFGPILAAIVGKLPHALWRKAPAPESVERFTLRYEPWIELKAGGWHALAAAALVLCVWWNLTTIPNAGIMVHPRVRWLGHVFRLDQNWSMFAPFPLKDDGWFVMEGKTLDDKTADVYHLTIGKPVSYDKPVHVADDFKNQRWRKYLMNIWLASNSAHRLFAGRYFCRRWNAEFDDEQRLHDFKIFYMREDTLPDYQPSEVKKIEIWSHNCIK